MAFQAISNIEFLVLSFLNLLLNDLAKEMSCWFRDEFTSNFTSVSKPPGVFSERSLIYCWFPLSWGVQVHNENIQLP